MNAPPSPLQLALASLPADASEPIVCQNFIRAALLPSLGFSSAEIIPEYNTGDGGIADFAARKNIGNEAFLHTSNNPLLLIEAKKRGFSIAQNTPGYENTVRQLKSQLLGTNARSAQWGIITNANHIQLFRKHGKVIFPASLCHDLTLENVDQVVEEIKYKIENPARALTVTIYNNKGGVGKTTTTVNLAAYLACLGKNVLVLDFDFNQGDLTRALGKNLTKGVVARALQSRESALKPAITTCAIRIKTQTKERVIRFDVIPADAEMVNMDEVKLQQQSINEDALHKKLDFARLEYDYIFIDASPNWRLISKLAVYAADVILIPTKHNGLASLENAVTAINQFIPEMQKLKKDGTPVALPIFFNGETITDPQLRKVQDEIQRMISKDRQLLLPYFFPRWTKANQNLTIYHLPNYAVIADGHFDHVPAVCKNKTAHECYKSLAKEYFLQ
jgi:cellulose biosynthesis protein BcsQ